MYKTDETAVDTPITIQYQSGNSTGVFTGLKIFTVEPDNAMGSDRIKLAVQIKIKPETLIKNVFHH